MNKKTFSSNHYLMILFTLIFTALVLRLIPTGQIDVKDAFLGRNIFFGVGILVANIIQGLTGFAGSLLAMPPSIHLQGLATAKVAVNTYGLISSLIIFSQNYKQIDWKQAKKLLVLMGIGLVSGIYLSNVIESKILLKIYAVFIILIALKEMFYKGDLDFGDIALTCIVLLAGIFQGLFVSGGPLLIIYVAKKLKEKNQIRGTLCFVWIFLNGYMMINQILTGQFTPHNILVTTIGLPGVFLGVTIGGYLATVLSKEKFLKVVYILLTISGLSLFL